MQKTPQKPYYVQDPEWYDERRALILKARREGQTLKAIGDTWGITAMGVSLVISRALKSRKSKESGDKTGANPRWTRRKGWVRQFLGYGATQNGKPFEVVCHCRSCATAKWVDDAD